MGCGRQRSGFKSPGGSFHTYIHLDYVRVEFLSCIKKTKNKRNKNQCAKVKARTHGCLEISFKILKFFDSFNDFSIHVGVGL